MADAPAPETPAEWATDLEPIRAELARLAAPEPFFNPGYWKRIDDWLGAKDSGVAYLAELRKFLAWHDSLPKSRRKKDQLRAFRNWLSKAESWSENRAQRQAIRSDARR